MGQNELGHQVFEIRMHTPVPDLSFIGVDSVQSFEGIRGPIQTALADYVNANVFIANGFTAVQQASVRNLRFQFSDGDEKLGFRHVDIVFDTDIVTDISWVSVAGVVGIIGGIAIALAGILTAQPWIIAAGIIITVGSILITAIEQVREVVTPGVDVWKFITSPLGLVIIGVGVGWFVWTSTGRSTVTSTARRAAPYVKKGAKKAGAYAKREWSKAFNELGGE